MPFDIILAMSITFTTDNAAYQSPEGGLDRLAIADSVNKVAEDIKSGLSSGVVMDVNGNKVGAWKL